MREPVWDSWQEVNGTDITADQSAFDGLTAGLQFTDFTTGRAGLMCELPAGRYTIQVGFYGEALEDGTSSFGCELWGSGNDGICQEICDITGLAGSGIADMTNADNTSRLFYDDLTVSEFSLWNDITSGNLLSGGLGFVEFTSRGITRLAPRFYGVGDTTESKRMKALVRLR